MKAQASIDALVLHSKQLALLWLAGFREACCFHRVYFFCKRSRVLLIRTGQCFILNGLIFLGSILLLKSVVTPILLWLLPEECWQSISGDPCYFREALKFYSFLRYILIELFYVLWFYPLYVFSFILSSIWYNDIAKQAFIVVGSNVQLKSEPSSLNESLNSGIVPQLDRPGGFGGVIIGIGEQLYSILLLSFFFIEVFAVGFIPCIGKTVNFLLLSWMYAYYCFEYKWNLSELGLEKRLDLFETNWAFFAGFGSPCVLAIFFFSQLVSYGVMAILFPLFVLTATGTQGEKVIDSHKKSWNGWGPRKLPVFHIANALSMQVLKTFSGSPNEQEQDKKFF